MKRHLLKVGQYETPGSVPSGGSVGVKKEEAKGKLTGRLEHLARKHGFTYNRVFIRNQKTRWGSCSSQNNIGLNMQTFRLPEELMDYVILHELVHTRVKNHSIDFWAELDTWVVDGKRLASRLRQYRLGPW